MATTTPPKHNTKKSPAKGTKKPETGGNVFTRKLGPLPGWAWIGLGVAGVLLYLHFRAGSSSAATSSTSPGDQASQDTTDADAMAYQALLDGLNNGYGATSPGSPTPTPTPSNPKPKPTSPGKGSKSKTPLTNYKLESKVGSGYNADNRGAFVGKYSGDTYSYAGSAGKGVLAAMLKAGDKVYYQDREGKAERVTNVNQVSNKTPLYTVTGYAPKKTSKK